MLPVEQRIRTDKTLSYNINEIEKIEEFSYVHRLTRLLYFIAFELNMH